jgi:signal transduction histidine kinase/ligand-binding sensor domain-containing protein/DNA-binding response OmpR family regulator
MIKSLLTYLATLLFAFPHLSKAQWEIMDIYFENITFEQGLIGNKIHTIIQDNEGFLWFSQVSAGCTRFDGYRFVHYQHDPYDSTSLPSNNISAFYIDNFNNLWIGTHNGLSMFNKEQDNFVNYHCTPNLENTLSHNQIYSIFQDTKGNLWIGTSNGLNLFNYNTKTFTRYINGFLHLKNKNFSIDDIIEDKEGTLWIISDYGGLQKFNPDNGEFTVYMPYPEKPEFSGNYHFHCLTSDKWGNIYLGSFSGIFRFDPKLEKFTGIWTFHEKGNILKNFNITSLLFDSTLNVIWIGTRNGIFIYHIDGHYFSEINSDPLIQGSFTGNEVLKIYKDRTGIIWIGTEQKGIYKHDPNKVKFNNRFPVINNSNYPLNKSVKSVYVDKKNILWIGTDYGLNQLDINGTLIKTYVHDRHNHNSISQGGVSALFEDSKSRFWIGTWGGAFQQFDRKTGLTIKYPYVETMAHDPRYVGSPCIYDFLEDKDGNLWLAMLKGLDKFNPETELFEHYIEPYGDIIWSIVFDKNERYIWCANARGLLKFDTHTGQFSAFLHNPKDTKSISSNNVNDVFVDKHGHLWVSTQGGVNQYSSISNSFAHIKKDKGLLGGCTYKIMEDDEGNLWITSDKGVSKLVPGEIDKKTGFREILEIKDYDNADGVKPYSAFGAFMCKDGQMFFGGVNGLNAFYPGDIKPNLVPPPVYITDIKFFGKSIDFKSSDILTTPIQYTQKITLKHTQNFFSLQLAALNYSNTEKNQFAYILEGFDRGWNYIGNKNEAIYTGVVPGNYVFRVKASNNDGVWNEKEASIRIIILPPFYKTYWFKILLGLIILFSIFLIISIRNHNLKLQKKKLYQLVKQKTIELSDLNQILVKQNKELERKKHLLEDMAAKMHEADQQRIRFYINVTHEFRTPLTLIINPLEIILSKIVTNGFLKQQLELVHNNAKRLLNLTRQLLDMRKIEVGSMKLQISKTDITSLVHNIYFSFLNLSENKHITFNLDIPHDLTDLYVDADKIEKCLINLLSNAFKFTNEGGTINLSISITSEIKESNKIKSNIEGKNPVYLKIVVSDTGIGIPPNQIDSIFDRFYQVSGKNIKIAEGTGIGLNLVKEFINLHHGEITVISEINNGSTFKIVIPVSKSAFSENEIIENNIIENEGHNNPIFNIDEDIIIDENIFSDPDNHNNNFPTLLIVEDTLDLRKFLCENLNPFYKIAEASNGLEGYDMALSIVPDIIISDVMMPVMDGIEFISKLKHDDRTSHIPVILLTAMDAEQDQLSGLSLGADDYIVKPFKFEVLKLKLSNLLKVREILREKYLKKITIAPSDIEVQSGEEQFLLKMVSVIENHIQDSEFNNNTLAIEIGMSKTQLYRKLVALTKLSPNEFIREIRLKRAEQLLRATEFNIAEIMDQVGFNSRNHFAKCFKDKYLLSPLEYKKQFCSSSND